MPIEFRCDQCGKLLRTADNTAGKQAKCPACQAIQRIPQLTGGVPAGLSNDGGYSVAPPEQPIGRNPFGIAPPPPQAPVGEVNPYQSPAYAAPDAYYAAPPGAARGFRPTVIEVGDVLGRTWQIFKSQLGMCIGVVLVCGVINFAVQHAANFAIQGAAATNNVAAVALVTLFAMAALILFQNWINVGQAIVLLTIGRGETATFGQIFSGGPYLVRVILAALALSAMMVGIYAVGALPALAVLVATQDPNIALVALIIGIIVALVPAVYIGLRYSQFLYLIIDRDMGVMDSLRTSAEVTSGNKLSIFVLGILTGLTAVSGILACCVGFLFTLPLAMLFYPVAYLVMTGQQTADELLS